MNPTIGPLRSLKGRYAFRVSAPSFIYPAGYINNVRRLAPYVDEIELLVLESAPESLPSVQTIGELVRLGNDLDICYNVHLPLDIHLAPATRHARQKAVDLLLGAMARVEPLAAVTHTLHLDYQESDHRPDTINAWRTRMKRQLRQVIDSGPFGASQISIETLDYPPGYFESIVTELDLAICLDMGHLIRYGHDLAATIATYGTRTDIIHLHGVADGRDHLSAGRLSPGVQRTILRYLETFNGSLSLEVFTPQRLSDSLDWLAKAIVQDPEKAASP